MRTKSSPKAGSAPAPDAVEAVAPESDRIAAQSCAAAFQLNWRTRASSFACAVPVALAATVRETLQRVGRTPDGGWRTYADGRSEPSAYPAFLAVLAGLSGPDDLAVRRLLERTERAGTPFMTGFFLRALIELGDRDGAVRRIRSLWGGMLENDARTFWEEFADGDGSPYAMYGRPFGKSLCHAWSSGPAALLPDAVLGLRPLADGWRRFVVEPHLGDLEWAEARVPAPDGDIVVAVRDGVLTVEVPPGTVLTTADGEHAGPAIVRAPVALG